MTIYINDNIQSITEDALAQMLLLLPDWRREQALRYRHLQGRIESALSYLLLCKALHEQYGITTQPHFIIGEHGKPTLLEYPDIHFNISHCKHAVAVAVADTPVGIDIEALGRTKDALARHVLSDEEYAAFTQSPNPDVEFTGLWTRKEALVKLTGKGITDDLKQLLTTYKDVQIETQTHESKGYVVSIAGDIADAEWLFQG